MPVTRQTDNTELRIKLDLRRYFLRCYHADEPADVLDCCQGTGVLWRQLRSEFKVASYWGLDLKRKRGRLKVDSARVLVQPGWRQNVIDVDAWGSPWKHWLALLPNVTRATTVFLTLGQVMMGIDRLLLESLGLGRLGKLLPAAIACRLSAPGVNSCLARATEHGVTIVEALEAQRPGRIGSMRYFGLRIEPRNSGRPSRKNGT